MMTLTNERGYWINCDEILEAGQMIDAHTLNDDGSFVITRDAEVTEYLEDDEHGYSVVATDKGDFSYYNSSVFVIEDDED